MSAPTKHPAAHPTVAGRARIDLDGVVRRLEEIRHEHADRKALNEELFQALSADPGIDAGERQAARMAGAAASAVCIEVERALAAVEAGTYGRCVACAATIPVERLEALPLARTCVTCPPP